LIDAVQGEEILLPATAEENEAVAVAKAIASSASSSKKSPSGKATTTTTTTTTMDTTIENITVTAIPIDEKMTTSCAPRER